MRKMRDFFIWATTQSPRTELPLALRPDGLKIDKHSKLVGTCTGGPRGFATFEDAVDVSHRRPETFEVIRAIDDQTSWVPRA